MKFLFILPLLFFTTTSTDMAAKHSLFTDALSQISPDDIEENLVGIQGLIKIGEDQKALALHNQSVAQGIFDKHNAIWQTAFDEEQAALGVQKEAEEVQAAALLKKDNAIAFTAEKKEEKENADNLVPPAKTFMDNEIARVDEEKESLEKVTEILGGMMPASAIETGRKLLSKSRTVALFTSPTFLSTLQNADPAALQQVLDIVNNLIDEGEDDRQYAIGEYDNRVSEAATAAQNLIDAEAAQELATQELEDAKVHTAEVTEIAKGKSAVEVEKRKIRDHKQDKLDVQIAFTNREITRIDGEKATHEEALELMGKLKGIAELLG